MVNTDNLSDEKLKSLLPECVAAKLSGVINAEYEVGEGCLLFVDISGFSSVASKLQKFTEEGAESLSFHLNAYFEQLIEVVRAHHGDIIFFSGDAMMVCWASEGPQSACTAFLCGTTLLSDAGRYSFTINTGRQSIECTMQLHIGSSYGKLNQMIVGGGGQWRYLITGSPVELACAAANLGTDGQLVISSKMEQIIISAGANIKSSELKEIIRGEEVSFRLYKSAENVPTAASKRRNKSKIAFNSEQKQNAALFSFDSVLSAMSCNESIGSMRTVSTVFIKLTSVDCVNTDESTLHSDINQCMKAVQKGLQTYDGVLNKVMMDDKGLICLCLFGIPLHSHENDSVRSVRFALGVGKRIHKLIKCPIAVGISRASVFCGLTGSAYRCEYTVLGDGVNIAARLMQKASTYATKRRHMIIDEETQSAKDIENLGQQVVEAEAILLKGQPEPLRCFHVVGQKQSIHEFKTGSGCDSNSGSESGRSISSVGTVSSNGSRISMGSNKSSFKLKNKNMSVLVMKKTLFPKASFRINMTSEGGFGAKRIAGNSVIENVEKTGSGRSLLCSDSPTSKRGNRQAPRNIKRASAGAVSPRTPTLGSDSDCSVEYAAESVNSEAPPLFGRGTEVATIDKLIKRFAKSHSDKASDKALVITGESRIGKTQLLLKTIDISPLPVLFIKCKEPLMKEQYAALRPIVSRMFNEGSIIALQNVIPQQHKQYIPLIHHIIKMREIPLGGPMLDELPLEERFKRTNSLALAMLKSHWGSFAIAVDDVQWVDDATARFLADANSAGVLIIATLKADVMGPNTSVPIDRKLSLIESIGSSEENYNIPILGSGNGYEMLHQAVLDSQAATRIALEPLELQDCVDMIRFISHGTHVHPNLAAQLREKSDGIPGCLTEMTEVLLEMKLIRVDLTGRVVASAEAEIDEQITSVIPTIEASVMAFVDRLTPPQKKILSLAAVLGLRFSSNLLYECLHEEGGFLSEDVANTLQDLYSIGLLKKIKGGSQGDSIFFVRSTVRDVIYNTVLVRERRRLHNIVAMNMMKASPPTPLHLLVPHHRKCHGWETGWPDLSDFYKIQIRKGKFDEAIKILAELLSCSEKNKLDTTQLDPIYQIPADASFVLYETGNMQASLDTLDLVKKPDKKGTSTMKKQKKMCCFQSQTIETRSLSESDFLWNQVLMLRLEFAFYSGTVEKLESLYRSVKKNLLREWIELTMAIRYMVKRGRNSTPKNDKKNNKIYSSTDPILLRQSPITCMLLANTKTSILEKDDILTQTEEISVYPLVRSLCDSIVDTTDLVLSTRPTVIYTLYSIEIIIQMFLGNARQTFDLCLKLKDNPVGNDRMVLYGLTLRSYLHGWYTEFITPPTALWSTVRDKAILEGCDKVRNDSYLVLLCEVRASLVSEFEGVDVANKLVARSNYIKTPYHAVVVASLLDTLVTLDEKALCESLLSLFQDLSSCYPFSRAAFLYYSGVVNCDDSFYESCVAEELPASKSPFAWRSACRLLAVSPEIPPVVSNYLANHYKGVGDTIVTAAGQLLRLASETILINCVEVSTLTELISRYENAACK